MNADLEAVLQEIVNAHRNPWVSKKGYAGELKVSEGVVETWMRRWHRGCEYKVIGNQTLIHRARATQWIEENGQKESGLEAEDLKSRSGKGRSGFTVKSLRATRISPLTSPV